jgi:hypothetical protein
VKSNFLSGQSLDFTWLLLRDPEYPHDTPQSWRLLGLHHCLLPVASIMRSIPVEPDPTLLTVPPLHLMGVQSICPLSCECSGPSSLQRRCYEQRGRVRGQASCGGHTGHPDVIRRWRLFHCSWAGRLCWRSPAHLQSKETLPWGASVPGAQGST